MNAEQALHKSLPAFSPYVPASLLPSIALVLLASTFALAFYFSTYVTNLHIGNTCSLTHVRSLPKDTLPLRETAVASISSILGGFGVVALFCSVGVNV